MLSYVTHLQVSLRREGGPRTEPSLSTRKAWYPGKIFRLGTHFSWQVEDLRHRPDCCRIVLFFASNPYFRDKVVVKEYVMNDSSTRRATLWRQPVSGGVGVGEEGVGGGRGGVCAEAGKGAARPFPPTLRAGYLPSRATPVERYRHCEREACSRWHRDGSLTLLGWMCEPNWAGSGRIAEVGRRWQGRERPCPRGPPLLVRGV